MTEKQPVPVRIDVDRKAIEETRDALKSEPRPAGSDTGAAEAPDTADAAMDAALVPRPAP